MEIRRSSCERLFHSVGPVMATCFQVVVVVYYSVESLTVYGGGVAQWLERRYLAGGLSGIYA